MSRPARRAQARRYSPGWNRPIDPYVFWWFERKGKFLRCEAREARAGGFELVIMEPDGTERIEHFIDSADLTKRQQEFEREIVAAGWSGPHGWNL